MGEKMIRKAEVRVAAAITIPLALLIYCDQGAAAATTSDLMNAMTVCGLGAKITLDNNTKEKAKLMFEDGVATGKATQDIAPRIADTVLGGQKTEFYDKYVKCLQDMLK